MILIEYISNIQKIKSDSYNNERCNRETMLAKANNN